MNRDVECEQATALERQDLPGTYLAHDEARKQIRSSILDGYWRQTGFKQTVCSPNLEEGNLTTPRQVAQQQQRTSYALSGP